MTLFVATVLALLPLRALRAHAAGGYLLPSSPARDLFSDDIVFYKSFDDD